MSETKNNYRDPYAELPETEMFRSTPRISFADYNQIRGMGHGAIQVTTASILHKLCHELKQHGISDYHSQDTYKYVIGELTRTDVDRGLGTLVSRLIDEFDERSTANGDSGAAQSGPAAAGTGGGSASDSHTKAADRNVGGGNEPVGYTDPSKQNLGSDAKGVADQRGGTGGSGGGPGKKKSVKGGKRSS